MPAPLLLLAGGFTARQVVANAAIQYVVQLALIREDIRLAMTGIEEIVRPAVARLERGDYRTDSRYAALAARAEREPGF